MNECLECGNLYISSPEDNGICWRCEIKDLKYQITARDENIEFYEKKCEELEQQLQTQPREIVEKIEKAFTEYLPLKDKTGAGFYGKLNEILKEYEEKGNETN